MSHCQYIIVCCNIPHKLYLLHIKFNFVRGGRAPGSKLATSTHSLLLELYYPGTDGLWTIAYCEGRKTCHLPVYVASEKTLHHIVFIYYDNLVAQYRLQIRMTVIVILRTTGCFAHKLNHIEMFAYCYNVIVDNAIEMIYQWVIISRRLNDCISVSRPLCSSEVSSL